MERAIRAFRDGASKRTRATGGNDWLEVSSDVVGKKNDKARAATGLKPNEVESKDGANERAATPSRETRATKQRTEPEVAAGYNTPRRLKTKAIEEDKKRLSHTIDPADQI